MGELVILMGPTGAGKSVQGKLLQQKLGWVHLSTGELLRQDPESAQKLASGQLAPAAQVERVLRNAVSNVDTDTTIVLDGFPRTTEQADWLDRETEQWGRQLTRVVLIEIDPETSAARLAQRQRYDDVAAARDRKWAAYRKMTQPLEAYYKSRHLLARVDGSGTVEEDFKERKAALS